MLYETCLTSFSPRENPKCAWDYKVIFRENFKILVELSRWIVKNNDSWKLVEMHRRQKAREYVRESVTIVFDLCPDWLRK